MGGWKGYRTAASISLALLLLVGSTPVHAVPQVKKLRALVQRGEKAPAFSLEDVDGRPVSFRPGRGRAALVVFWSVFCPMCKEMMPGINRFSERHGGTVRVVAVNLDGKRFSNAVRAWMKESTPRFPVGLDELRDDFFVASDPFGVEKTPTAILVDEAGRVRGAWAAEGIRDFERDADRIVADLQKSASAKQ